MPYLMGWGLRIGVCSDAGSWNNIYIPELLLDWSADGHVVTWTHDATVYQTVTYVSS